MNVNCSARVHFGFEPYNKTALDSNIKNAVLVRCGPFASYSIAMFELLGNLIIQDFIFVKCKMTMQAVPKQYSKENFTLLFKNCVSDTSEQKQDYLSSITFINVSFNARIDDVPEQGVDFGVWRCKTAVLPTPRPTISMTFLATPTMSPAPSMTAALLNFENFNEPQIEEEDVYESNKGIRLDDIVQLIVLGLLVVLTIFVFMLAKKKTMSKSKMGEFADESQILVENGM